MSMVTSCPSCATTFRVLQEQLKARQGKVRCGKCSEVFDAFKTLASYPEAPLPESPPARIESGILPLTTPAPVQTTLAMGPATVVELAQARATDSEFTVRRAPSKNGGVSWVVAIMLAVIFVLQLLYVFRAPLSAALPGARALFERVCAITGCTVPLPKRTDVLAIESSDLQSDPARPGVIVLMATLRNRGRAPVEYPAFELTLTNVQDLAVARRVFLPRDYLQRGTDVAAGMGALAEVNVRIELDTGDLKAAGYRLFLFYP